MVCWATSVFRWSCACHSCTGAVIISYLSFLGQRMIPPKEIHAVEHSGFAMPQKRIQKGGSSYDITNNNNNINNDNDDNNDNNNNNNNINSNNSNTE